MINFKNFINLVIYVVIFSAFIPMIVYLWKFSKYDISDNVDDWIKFGDIYVSLASLILLSLLSYIVSIKSINESNKNSLMQKRHESYKELTDNLPFLLEFFPNFQRGVDYLKIDSFKEDKYSEHELNLIHTSKMYSKFHYYLINFQIRYNHIFPYNYKKIEFVRLIENSNILLKYILSINDSIMFKQDKLQKFDEESFKQFSSDLNIFVNEIRFFL